MRLFFFVEKKEEAEIILPLLLFFPIFLMQFPFFPNPYSSSSNGQDACDFSNVPISRTACIRKIRNIDFLIGKGYIHIASIYCSCFALGISDIVWTIVFRNSIYRIDYSAV